MILSAAAPAFADKIPADLHQLELTQHTQLSVDGDRAGVRFSTEDAKLAEIALPARFRQSADDVETAFFIPRADRGDAFGRVNFDDRGKHEGRRHPYAGGSPASSVTVPEPSAQLLLLFGLAGLGMLVYRRNSVQQAI